jgi:hypothetical protein
VVEVSLGFEFEKAVAIVGGEQLTLMKHRKVSLDFGVCGDYLNQTRRK